MPHANDLDLTAKDISSLSSVDAVAGFLTKLGYPTGARKELTGKSLGLTGDSADAVKHVELLVVDGEDFFRVVFVKVRSITAKIRNDLARKLGQTGSDHLIILVSNFDVLEFVLLDKRTRQIQGPVGGGTVQIIPRIVTVNRKSNTRLNRRILRRLTWTEGDGLDQFEKLRSVFESAAFTTHYFQNRALFADHFLQHRLPEDSAWRDNPSNAFAKTTQLMRHARKRWTDKPEQTVRDELFDPVWKLLGFKARANKAADAGHLEPDYILSGKDGTPRTVAFVYRWDRWLDGPDPKDVDTPDENPGAAVISALAEDKASWVIVTNGKLWRLYSKDAHSRSTNFYEVDLEEALVESAETDPNEAFRYWWLFFRQEAFEPVDEDDQARCWLDSIVQGSRDYAKRLGERLKDRIFVEIFPHLAQGFLAHRKQQGNRRKLTEDELRDTFQATLTLLYRLLFLLYAEARDLLPIGESPYLAASLKRIKEEVADNAGQAEKQVAESLKKAYNSKDCKLYDRLARLFKVMDKGDASLNVPCYNGGLFITKPDKSESREHHIARFLADNKVPDLNLALAIDRLSRDQDEKTLGLVFIDYKSLEVRHLGSIYEGLLEFKLKVAEEDLATKTEKKKEKYIPLAKAKSGRGNKTANVAVRKGEVYLSNDKAERKATGSYYTPDPIVEYIVEHTVGPVLREKLDALRSELRKAGKTFHRHVKNATSNPGLMPSGKDARTFAGEKTYAEHKDLVDGIFDFRTLDPAMGSGHFLVEAVDYITDAILDFLNRFPNNPVNFALEKTRNSILVALEDQGVKVDSNRLTDVNLLKRHVLKRCIYGVDLNPMAVELAKVSLWLDAFTLGAPLSFLDHHLRCGNSLIGASFKDLEKATEGQLFSIDYQPLLDAIRNVLFVNAMADATAAEVHESVRRYADARKALSGYKIVFDLLVADHFLDLRIKPSSLLSHANDLCLDSEADFLASLSCDDERGLIESVETLAQEADRRFFHWEIEFPETFLAFADADHRRVERRDVLSPGDAGFDAVVGNPPYVRQESFRALKPYLKHAFTTFESTNDLYVYFQEAEVDVLRADGRMGMIVANKWMRASYGRRIRHLLRHVSRPAVLIDFGHAPVFPDADTFPCILIVQRRRESHKALSGKEYVEACPVPRENWDNRMDLSRYVRKRSYDVPVCLLRDSVWSVEHPSVQRVFERIRGIGSPLAEYCGVTPMLGIKTGYNEAFVIDSNQRAAMVNSDSRATEVIKPLLRGRDAMRWIPRKSGMFLITIPSSENYQWQWSNAHNAEEVFAKEFPGVFSHLDQHRIKLQARQDQGRYWWELRSCDYYDKIASPKILIQSIAYHSLFSFDPAGAVPNNSLFFLPTRDPWVLAVLNSPLAWAFMFHEFPHKKDEAIAMDSVAVATLPIPPNPNDIEVVDLVTGLGSEVRKIDNTLCEFLTELAGVLHAAKRTKIAEWLADTDEVFLARLAKETGDASIGGSTADQVLAIKNACRSQIMHHLEVQVQLERRLARIVEQSLQITDDERQFLRSSQTLRDPLEVLADRLSRLHGVPNHGKANKEEDELRNVSRQPL